MSNIKHFGAVGDGKTDDTKAFLHAVRNSDGQVFLPRGTYRITQSIVVDMDRLGRFSLDGDAGGATVFMDGIGPALHLVGTHGGTGDPGSVKPNVWQRQRMPSIRNVEIVGGNIEADGVRLQGTMQAVLEGVAVRQCRHGIHLFERNRNVLISHCHVYHNTGVGVFLDGVNLHQINIAGNHISYNRLGGIRIEASEVRNLQITGNDIEYNNHRAHGAKPEPTAEIHVDVRKGKRLNGEQDIAGGAMIAGRSDGKGRPSVREVTIASNTIQATPSPGGANIRILGDADSVRPGMWTITGNVLGNQEVNLHVAHGEGFSITGNFIYSGKQTNVLLESCEQITLGSNTFGHNLDDGGVGGTPHGKWTPGVKLTRCNDATITGCSFQDRALPPKEAVRLAPVELKLCDRVTLTGCHFTNGYPFGLFAADCNQTLVTGCTFNDTRDVKQTKAMVRWQGHGKGNAISNSALGKGVDARTQIDDTAGVAMKDNIEV